MKIYWVNFSKSFASENNMIETVLRLLEISQRHVCGNFQRHIFMHPDIKRDSKNIFNLRYKSLVFSKVNYLKIIFAYPAVLQAGIAVFIGFENF